MNIHGHKLKVHMDILPFIFIDKKASTSQRMWILLLPSANSKLEMNRDKKFANDFAKYVCVLLHFYYHTS